MIPTPPPPQLKPRWMTATGVHCGQPVRCTGQAGSKCACGDQVKAELDKGDT